MFALRKKGRKKERKKEGKKKKKKKERKKKCRGAPNETALLVGIVQGETPQTCAVDISAHAADYLGNLG